MQFTLTSELDTPNTSDFDSNKTQETLQAIYNLLENNSHMLAEIQAYLNTHDKPSPIIAAPVVEIFSDGYPMHLAARIGDVEQVKTLYEQHYSIHQTDIFGSTPLHVAAMYGHIPVMEFLMANGADINQPTYEGNFYAEGDIHYSYSTPLDLAIRYAPDTQTLDFIIDQGGKSSYLENQLSSLADDLLMRQLLGEYEAFELGLQKVEALAEKLPQSMWYFEEIEDVPVGIFLEAQLSLITDPDVHARLLETVNQLNTNEILQSHNEAYMAAKNLMHLFPSSKVYGFTMDEHYSLISAEGYYQVTSVTGASHYLSEFADFLANYADQTSIGDTYSLFLKPLVFENMAHTYQITMDATLKSGLHETSDFLYQAYEQGQTLVLSAYWSDHTVNVILDKSTNLYGIANAGAAFEDSMTGFNAYTMHHPIEAEDIYHILNNIDQIDLEFKRFYDLGLTPNDTYTFETEPQYFGNCGWNAQLISEEALIILELNKTGLAPDVAKELGHIWFEEFNDHQKTEMLKDYLKAPALDSIALKDILYDYHAYPHETPLSAQRAELIHDALMSIQVAPLNKPEITLTLEHQPLEGLIDMTNIIPKIELSEMILI